MTPNFIRNSLISYTLESLVEILKKKMHGAGNTSGVLALDVL